jgi:type II secretory pathway component PulK
MLNTAYQLFGEIVSLGSNAAKAHNKEHPVLLKKQSSTGSGERLGIKDRESGVALLIVIFIIAIASILVLSLSHSTYLAQRLHQVSEQRFRAEYLLKSTLSVAQVIVSQDPPEGTTQPPWQAFVNGVVLPGDRLGLTDPDLRIALEITPEESKMPLRWLQDPQSSFFKRHRDEIARLFENLGFDNHQPEVGPGTNGQPRLFSSRELVANLIDYIDKDDIPYGEDGFSGIEVPVSANRPIERLEELSQIPGFTSRRLRMLSPHVSPADFQMINVNFATREVLKAIDPSLSEEEVTDIIEAARGPNGPLTSNSIVRYMPNFSKLSSFLNFRSTLLQVIGKIDIGGNRYFLKALIRKGSGSFPSIQTQQFYG